jgi:hypothetical protein
MNYKKLFLDGLIIVAIFTALIPTTDLIYQLMNTPSDIAFIGPVLWFGVMALSLWIIIQRAKSISNNFKQSKEWQKNQSGKSSEKKKENKKNKNKSTNN